MRSSQAAVIAVAAACLFCGPLRAQTVYDPGNPADLEQLWLELVNRARANPGAEAARLGIDLNQGLPPGTITNTPKQPLACNPHLLAAARAHSQWMIDTDTFSHTGVNGTNAGQRMTAAGYVFSGSWAWGENIGWQGSTSASPDLEAFARAIHDNLFLSPGHRTNICDNTFDELGPGLRDGVFTSGGTNYNSLLGTQNFAASASTPGPMLLGVAYYDFDGDNLYDPGEGIAGLSVNATGASYRAITASAGGYAFPIPPAAGSRTVTFTGPALSVNRTLSLPGSINYKEDLRLTYSPPVISGNATASAGIPSPRSLSQVPGADQYRVAVHSAASAPPDPAENLSRFSVQTSWSYSVLQTAVKDSGTSAYRLAHNDIGQELLTYLKPFLPGPAGQITFRSRLNYATSDQIATVEVSDNGGLSWAAIYTQAGGMETSFNTRAASLSAYSGKIIQLRFRYRFEGGSYYSGITPGTGWHIDNVSFADTRELTETETAGLAPGQAFSFLPGAPGVFVLRARPLNAGRLWPWGPPKEITVSAVTAYPQWAAAWETALGLAPGALAPAASYPGDGTPNLLRYAAGAAPGAKGHEIAPAYGVASFSGNSHLVFSFRRRAGTGSGATESGYTIDGITYTVETSSTLAPGSWQTGPSVIQQTGVTPNGDGTETVSVRLLAPLGPRQFVRLRVTQN